MIRKGCSLAFLFSMALLFSSWFWKQDTSGALNQFISKASRLIEKKYKVRTCTTGGAVVGGVSEIVIHFECDQIPDIALARQYLVGIVEDVYYLANTDKNLRPFLKDQHIRREDLDVVIYFNRACHPTKTREKPYIGLADIMKGNAYFRFYDIYDKRFKVEHKELYEEARKVILGEEVADQGSSS